MANPRRQERITVRGVTYRRIPARTHVVTRQDDIVEVCERYTRETRRPGDVIFVSEKVCAITQGRGIPTSEIRVGWLAKLLWPRVRKVSYGVGLRSPYSMQCAIDECGGLRILTAAAIGGLTRAFGRRGDFYRIAGMQAATIDAAGTSPLQPDCVVLGPKDPDGVAERIAKATGLAAAIVDVNDIGGSWVLGASGVADRGLIQDILRDNPLGQTDEQTPIGLIRVEPAGEAPKE
jgi:hypothetical protein